MKNIKTQNKSKRILTELEKKQFADWGKLGGRPTKEIKRVHQINIKFTEDEYKQILLKAEQEKIKINDYCRIILSEKKFPNVEQNKTLIEYANNFSRISNFIKMGIFTNDEKGPLLTEIKILIADIKENIKW